jgi:hypothetical protein
VKTATQTTTSSLTTIAANEATGSATSLTGISNVVAPVTLYLTTALNQLTATIPSLPASPLLTETAQTLSTNLAGDLQDLKEIPGLLEPFSAAAAVPGGSPAVSSATATYEATQAVSDYTGAVGLVNETFSGIVPDFVRELDSLVAQ